MLSHRIRSILWSNHLPRYMYLYEDRLFVMIISYKTCTKIDTNRIMIISDLLEGESVYEDYGGQDAQIFRKSDQEST